MLFYKLKSINFLHQRLLVLDFAVTRQEDRVKIVKNIEGQIDAVKETMSNFQFQEFLKLLYASAKALRGGADLRGFSIFDARRIMDILPLNNGQAKSLLRFLIRYCVEKDNKSVFDFVVPSSNAYLIPYTDKAFVDNGAICKSIDSYEIRKKGSIKGAEKADEKVKEKFKEVRYI